MTGVEGWMKMEGEAVGGTEETKDLSNDLLKGLKKTRRDRGSTAKERISKMPPCAAGKRSSIYRGVTRHRWTGRYEAHLWDKSTWNQNQNKKGKQVYLGAYDEEEAAARAYDLAALKYWGPGTLINFPVSDYARDIEEMQSISREDYLASLRRKSSGFSRGMAKYRGLARQSQNSKWDTSFGRVLGNKYFSTGNSSTSEEAAAALEMSQGDYRGFGMIRNIDLSTYIRWWQPNKLHETETPAPRVADESHSMSEEKPTQAEEPDTPEWPGRACEPYQLPSLGLSHSGRPNPSPATALSILHQSSSFKQMLERASARKHDTDQDNNAGEDVEKTKLERVLKGKECLAENIVTCKETGCSSGGYQPPVQTSALFPFGQVPSVPLIQECTTMEPVSDSIWTSLGPPTSGIPLANTVSIC
eukprot:Gb_19663 [translate_table: standard]